MKKIILFILMLSLFITACTSNAKDTNVDSANTENNIEKNENEDLNKKTPENIKEEPNSPDSTVTEIEASEFFTGEIITDGYYELTSSRRSSICFVPDKESRVLIKEKFRALNLNFLDDESYSIYYDDESLTESLPGELGIYKVKAKFDLDNNSDNKRFKLIDIELTNSIDTILYEGKSYETNNLDMNVRVKDRVCGLIVNYIDRMVDGGIRVTFCGEIETEGYYNIAYSEMNARNMGYIYYDEKSKENVPIMMGESNNHELFLFINKEELFNELMDYSSFGRGKFKISNFQLIYNYGTERGPSDILTDISLDEKYKDMFKIKDTSTTNLVGYNDDFAIVSNIVEYDENNYPSLYDYYYINKNNPEKMWCLLTSKYIYQLDEVFNENEFLLYNASKSTYEESFVTKCKITDKGVEVSDEKINASFHKQINSSNIAFDGDKIFYINSESKLYSIKKDGTVKELIFDKDTIHAFQIYDNKIYMLHLNYKEDIPCKLYYVNKDGTDINELKLDMEFTSKYYIADFLLDKELLFFVVHDHNSTNDVDFPKHHFIYDSTTDSLISLYENNPSSFGKPVIYNNVLYSLSYGPSEYDILHKYNVDTKEKSTININKNSHKENFITSKMHINRDRVYYSGKTYIDMDSLDSLTKTNTLFEDNEFMVVNMTMTDEDIYFVNMDDLRKKDKNSELMNLDIYKMKRNGGEINKIYTETMGNTNLPPNAISIEAEDGILIYRNRIADTNAVMDLDGNLFHWNLE